LWNQQKQKARTSLTEQHTTPFSKKCEILGDLWMDYRTDEEFQDFVEYNDLGLPLAYAIASGIVDNAPMAQDYINETFDLLITSLGLTDTGFDNLGEVLDSAVK
jgi:hypothetical protein